MVFMHTVVTVRFTPGKCAGSTPNGSTVSQP